jgi:hypothetical protein
MLKVFETSVLRIMFVTRNWRKLLKEEFYSLGSLSSIVSVIKSRDWQDMINTWEVRCPAHNIVICLTASVPIYATYHGCFESDIINLTFSISGKVTVEELYK